MTSTFDVTRRATPPPAEMKFTPLAPSLGIEQENARLRLALRELQHRSSNQRQFLIGLAEMEMMQHPQVAALGCSVRLSTMAHAFVTLNKALDAQTDDIRSDRKIGVRIALETMLTLLQAIIEDDTLQFEVQDAWLPEKGCAALMLVCAELVFNAVKYGHQETQVTFTVQSNQGTLEVRDDGHGFPSGFRVEEQGRQGLQLVDALCRFDLNGELRCHSNRSGGIVIVTFPVLSPPEVVPVVEANTAFCAMEGVVCFDALSE
jgi:two-component sensor histidine kinase